MSDDFQVAGGRLMGHLACCGCQLCSSKHEWLLILKSVEDRQQKANSRFSWLAGCHVYPLPGCCASHANDSCLGATEQLANLATRNSVA